ncbi:probable N-acetyltransferase camello [Xyrichtys novacula]|uniref:Probable N-acetyltransferase camello n=1 Tax=Xyrichtys novacula TaxID=13765 RepID=A0AAV1HG36_XYRNO|nr:probable N-acetyltransferase camello [Xyrichtys novacula]
MAQKNSTEFSIRKFSLSDEPVIRSLFRDGILEHVYPAFFRAMSHPDHIGIALSICMAGYVLGGSSYFQALLFGSAWAGLIYYSCHEIYEGYVLRRLRLDMADIQAHYLENPDNGLWVAEADDKGKSKVVGMVAVTGKRPAEDAERFDDCNGSVFAGAEFGREAGDGSYGELSHLVVFYPWRRKNLGARLMGQALDFCKERGFSRLIADVSSPQAASVSLYQKFGFIQTSSHRNTHTNRMFSKLARINVMQMEKFI